MQLARSGVKQFTLYDFDQMHLGNLARVGAFVNSVGRTKVGALAEQLEATVPGVRAVPIAYEVGIHVGPRALVADAPDLLINLSGERVSTDETNLAALALEKPALFAWVSTGVAAGRIFRVRPYQSPCYHCVREAGLVPIPSRGPVPMDPEIAWFGASFNVDAFAAAVARIAVLTLAGETVSATNPLIGWSLMIRVPIVRMIRQPPLNVPSAIAVAADTTTQVGTLNDLAAMSPCATSASRTATTPVRSAPMTGMNDPRKTMTPIAGASGTRRISATIVMPTESVNATRIVART